MIERAFQITNKTGARLKVTSMIPEAVRPSVTSIETGETVTFFKQPSLTTVTLEPWDKK